MFPLFNFVFGILIVYNKTFFLYFIRCCHSKHIIPFRCSWMIICRFECLSILCICYSYTIIIEPHTHSSHFKLDTFRATNFKMFIVNFMRQRDMDVGGCLNCNYLNLYATRSGILWRLLQFREICVSFKSYKFLVHVFGSGCSSIAFWIYARFFDRLKITFSVGNEVRRWLCR